MASTEILALIASASNVIIMAHKYPDYDAFGASLGFARLAMYCGVKVNVVTDFKNQNIKNRISHILDLYYYIKSYHRRVYGLCFWFCRCYHG